MMTELPSFVKETVDRIVKLTSTPENDLLTELNLILQDKYFTEHAKEFPDEESKYRYACGQLWSRYRARKPMQDFEVVPIGYEGMRITKSGQRMSRMYLFMKDRTRKTLLLFGNEAELYKTVSLGNIYKTKLSLGRNGSLSADSRTKFENPQAVPIDFLSIYTKMLNVPTIPFLADAGQMGNLSLMQKEKPEYVDSLDWRIVRGIITGSSQGQRDDKTEWGSYRLIDQSLGTEESVSPDGTVRSPTFSVWLDPSLMLWGQDSEVYCVGTVTLNKNKEASMNAINVIPIHGRPAK